MARLKLAVDLAARFDALLLGIAACELPRRLGHGKGGLITSKMVESERRYTLYELSLVEAAFRGETQNLRRAIYCPIVMEPEEFLVRQTCATDLVLCNRPYNGGIDEWFADLSLGALLIRLGCPLLVVPLNYTGPIGRRIIIAWKDTREARRAVREAWPFLKQAEAVSVVTVGSDSELGGAECISDILPSGLITSS